MTLSKSSFIKGSQCVKSLFLHFYHSRLGIERDELDTSKFETGDAVGNLAKGLFPGGVDCGIEITKNWRLSVELTLKAIAGDRNVIYEAAFTDGTLLAITDILVRDGEAWNAYEGCAGSTELSARGRSFILRAAPPRRPPIPG